MKKHQVSIVIITEKSEFSYYENISLKRSLEVFEKFNKYLVIPEHTNPENLIDEYLIEVIRLPDYYFRNINSYSFLLLSNFFL